MERERRPEGKNHSNRSERTVIVTIISTISIRLAFFHRCAASAGPALADETTRTRPAARARVSAGGRGGRGTGRRATVCLFNRKWAG